MCKTATCCILNTIFVIVVVRSGSVTVTSDGSVVPAADDRRVRIVDGMAAGEEMLKCLEEREGKYMLVPLRLQKFPHGILWG